MESRRKNAWRNISTGLLYKILMLACSFGVRTVFTWTLGIEYLGLNSLFTSVLNILNLAELGFGSAMVVSMYKPFAQHSIADVNALLNLYKKAYHAIGIIVLCIGLAISPWISNLITGSYPKDINLYVIYYLNLLGVVVTYFLFAYKACILTVAQRNDIANIVHIIVMLFQYSLQLVVLVLYKNYYLYIVLLPITNAAVNIILACIVRKLYPEYVCEGVVDASTIKDLRKKITGLALNKVSNTLCNGLDSIVISMFLGLLALGKYNIYYYVFSSLNALLFMVISSVTSTVGNSLAVCDRKKNYEDFKKISFWWSWGLTWTTTCLIVLYQPFVEFWQGKEALFDTSTMTVFCVYYYVYHASFIVYLYKDAAGLWWEDKWRVAVEGFINLTFNIVLVQFLGVNGVLLSTIITQVFISLPWQAAVLYKKYFQLSMLQYFGQQILNFGITAFVCGVTYFIASTITATIVLELFLRGILCVIIPNLMLVFIWLRSPYFKQIIVRVHRKFVCRG